MLLAFERFEANGYHWPWFARVPSFSNIADDPARLGLVEEFPGMARDSCICPLLGCRLEDFKGVTRDTMKSIGVKRMCVTPHLSVEKGDPLLSDESDESSFYNSCEYRCFAGFVISIPKDPK